MARELATGQRELAAGQRELARLLSAPEGVRAALDGAGEPAARMLDALVRGDARLSAPLRLEVYASAIFHRIREALAAEFEALAEALGAGGFHDLALAYLIAHPSRTPSLRDVGAALPGFLRDHGAAEPFRRRWPWAADLAELEWALSLAFDAAEAAPLAREDLAAVAPEDWDGLVLGFQPAVRLLRLDWPVERLLPGARPETGAGVAAAPTAIAVWRRDESPRHRVLEPLEAALLEAGLAGETFGALCARAAEVLGAQAAPARAAELLAGWLASGLLARPSEPLVQPAGGGSRR
jgi:hypothetical protein